MATTREREANVVGYLNRVQEDQVVRSKKGEKEIVSAAVLVNLAQELERHLGPGAWEDEMFPFNPHSHLNDEVLEKGINLSAALGDLVGSAAMIDLVIRDLGLVKPDEILDWVEVMRILQGRDEVLSEFRKRLISGIVNGKKGKKGNLISKSSAEKINDDVVLLGEIIGECLKNNGVPGFNPESTHVGQEFCSRRFKSGLSDDSTRVIDLVDNLGLRKFKKLN